MTDIDINTKLESNYVKEKIKNINAQRGSSTLFTTKSVIKKDYIYIMFGDIIIKKMYNDNSVYSVTFETLTQEDIIKFQLWSDQHPELNNNREIKYFNAKNWIKSIFVDKSSKYSNYFTCILQLETGKQLKFKIEKITINEYDKVKFYVSGLNKITIKFLKKKELGLLFSNTRCVLIEGGIK